MSSKHDGDNSIADTSDLPGAAPVAVGPGDARAIRESHIDRLRANIPAEIQALKQSFLLWRLWARKASGKPDKLPFYKRTRKMRYGKQNLHKDSQNLESFESVLDGFLDGKSAENYTPRQWKESLPSGHYTGIGLAMRRKNRILGIDVDCKEAGCLTHEEVMELAGGTTYVELSPSGKGYRLFFLLNDVEIASIPQGKSPRHVEVYQDWQYLTLTGNIVEGSPKTLGVFTAERKAVLLKLACFNPADDAASRIHSAKVTSASSTQKPIPGMTLERAREILYALPEDWFDDYTTWLTKTGMAMHHQFDGSPEAHAVWDEASADRCPGKYTPGCCEEKWASFGHASGLQITMRTLRAEIRKAKRAAAQKRATEAIDGIDIAAWYKASEVGRFDLDHPPAPRWLFRDIAPMGKVLVTAGAGGSSKSYLMLLLAAHYAAGLPFDVFEPVHDEPGNDEVLVLCGEEDEDDLHRRVAAIVRASGFDAAELAQVQQRMHVRSLFDFTEPLSLAQYEYEEAGKSVGPGNLFAFLRKVLQANPMLRWLVLDPMVLLHHLDENDNKGMAEMMGLLGRLANEFDVAIWLVHHMSKTGARADQLNVQSVRGAGAIIDNARAALLMQRVDKTQAEGLKLGTGEDGQQFVELAFGKPNNAPFRDSTYFRVGLGGALLPVDTKPIPMSVGMRKNITEHTDRQNAKEWNRQQAMDGVLELLAKEGKLTQTEIFGREPGGFSKQVVTPVLATAKATKLIAIEKGKNNANLYSLTSDGWDHWAGLA